MHLELFGEILEEGYDISRPTPDDDPLGIFPPALKLLITLLALPPSSLPPILKPSKLEKLIARNDFPQQWHKFLGAILQARFAQYASTLEEDKQHLEVYKQRLQGGIWLTNQQETRRRFMALSVRVGEKEVLRHAVEVVGEFAAVGEVGEKRKASEQSSGNSTPKRAKR